MKSSFVLSIHASIWLIVGMLLFLSPSAWAEFYKYTDSSGAVVITNKLEDVPQRYRQRVKVVWDEDLEVKDPLARRRAEADKLREQRESQQEQRKTVEKMKTKEEGKTLVISIDEETGQVIRRFE
jgi:hypothetical protein